MARILFLAHRIPYPPNKGDKIRSWHFLQHLMQRHTLHLGFFVDDRGDLEHIEYLRQRSESLCFQVMSPMRQKLNSLTGLVAGTSLTERAYPSRRLRTYVKGLVERGEVDLIYVYSAAPFGWLPPDLNGVPVVTDLVDVDSAKWQAYGDQAAWPVSILYRREATKLARFEASVARASKLTLLVSDEEAALLRGRIAPTGDANVTVCGLRNGVDADKFRPLDAAGVSARRPLQLIFTGAMDYQPNIEAVIWFTKQVFAPLRTSGFEAEFIIAGRPVAPAVARLDRENGVRVLGSVDDMAATIAAADMVVAPLLTARGIQNKVLEGMAVAKPVIATRWANEGINAPHGEAIWIADTAAAFREAILRLADDAVAASELGARARDFVLQEFAWEARFQELDALLAPLLPDNGLPDQGAQAS